MHQKKLEKDNRCPLQYRLRVFGGKWKSRIICVLAAKEPLRYSELRKEMANITDAVLATTLKELIADGILVRQSYDEIPPRVEYSLTSKGTSVVPILQSICRWSGVFIGALGLRQLSQEAVQGADALLHRAYGVDGDKLVGLIRVPGDSETLTQIHYMLVHPDYQGQGIAGKMLELIKEKYKDYLYIESMPKDKSNVPLYVKHRFTMTENGAANFNFLLIRGISAGALHLLCGVLSGFGVSYVFRRRWLAATGAVGILGACIGFHAIYNLLITADGVWKTAGYLFPSLLLLCLYAAKQLLPRGNISFE